MPGSRRIKSNLTPLALMAAVLCLLISQGCGGVSGAVVSHRPVVKNDHIWSLVSVCGYEPCRPVPALKGQDIHIRVEPDVGTDEERVLTIELTFQPDNDEYEFDPSMTYATFDNGEVVYAKPRKCNTTPHQIHHFKDALRRSDAVTGRHRLGKYDCYTLYFDVDDTLVIQSFALKIGGLIRDERVIEVPEVFFDSPTQKAKKVGGY